MHARSCFKIVHIICVERGEFIFSISSKRRWSLLCLFLSVFELSRESLKIDTEFKEVSGGFAVWIGPSPADKNPIIVLESCLINVYLIGGVKLTAKWGRSGGTAPTFWVPALSHPITDTHTDNQSLPLHGCFKECYGTWCSMIYFSCKKYKFTIRFNFYKMTFESVVYKFRWTQVKQNRFRDLDMQICWDSLSVGSCRD